MRDGEWKGIGEQGKRRVRREKELCRCSLARHYTGPRGPRSPSSCARAPPPSSHTPPLQGGSGEIPSPGDFQNPSAGAASAFPEPLLLPPLQRVTTACLLHRLCWGRLFFPEPARPGPESRLSKNPDITSHPAPLWQDRQTISAQRGISPRSRAGTGERTEQEDNPSPRLKPLSQLTRCGARRGGGAKEPCVGREEARGRGGERDRGRSGDRRE